MQSYIAGSMVRVGLGRFEVLACMSAGTSTARSWTPGVSGPRDFTGLEHDEVMLEKAQVNINVEQLQVSRVFNFHI